MESKFKIGDHVIVQANSAHSHPAFTGDIVSPTTAGSMMDWIIQDENGMDRWYVAEPDMMMANDGNQVTLTSPTGEQEIVNLPKSEPRRIKALATNKDALLAMFFLNGDVMGKDRFVLNVCDSSSLPKDIKFEDMAYDYGREAFLIIISHPSFDICHDENKIPIVDLPMKSWDVTRVIPNTRLVDEAWYNAHTQEGSVLLSPDVIANNMLVSKQDLETLVSSLMPRDLTVNERSVRSRIRLELELKDPPTKAEFPKHVLPPKRQTEVTVQDCMDEAKHQTSLLTQIRDIMAEGRKDAQERLAAIKSQPKPADEVKQWNRAKGIINPSELILSKQRVLDWALAIQNGGGVFVAKAMMDLLTEQSTAPENRNAV